jgi:hypothetical protein
VEKVTIFDPALLYFEVAIASNQLGVLWGFKMLARLHYRPLTLKVRWTSFADFCTDWLFYRILYSFLWQIFSLTVHRFYGEHLSYILIKQTGQCILPGSEESRQSTQQGRRSRIPECQSMRWRRTKLKSRVT